MPTTLIPLAMLLAGCAGFPALDGTISDAARAAPAPRLIPLAPVDLPAPPDAAPFTARLAALQARAAALRARGIDPLQ